MAKIIEISRDNFGRLLAWLDPNEEIAARKYEMIRSSLIKVFYTRGCHLAEELADETIDRVVKKIHYLQESYEGDPKLYFYGTGKKVLQEYLRKPKIERLPDNLVQKQTHNIELEYYYECLSKCLQKLEPEQRELITEYYQLEKTAKIDLRKEIAQRLGMKYEQLRVYAFRVRKDLRKCILNCVKELSGETF